MSSAAAMLRTHPVGSGGIDDNLLVGCIEACSDCAQACTACADACLSEDAVDRLRTCIRINLDCADICATTSRVMSRMTGDAASLPAAVLRACSQACHTCAEECGGHAEHHEHCRVCAEVCRRCQDACDRLLAALG